MIRAGPALLNELILTACHGTAGICTTHTAQQFAPALASLIRHKPPSFSQTSVATYATAAPRQIVKVKGQQSSNGDSSNSSWTSTRLAAAGAVAATAAAGAWAWWTGNSANHVQADAVSAGASSASQRTQGAVASCFAGPLVALLQGLSPTDAQLQSMAKTLTIESSLLNAWQLVDALWGLAMFGAKLNLDQLQQLGTLAVGKLHDLTVYQAIVTVWSVILLSGCSNSRNSSDQAAAAQLASTAWQQLQQRLRSSRADDYDEASVLYLLHAAVQQAAAGSADRSGDIRASLQEVQQQVASLPKRVRNKVTAAYQEYVPFQGYIESPFLTILHIIKALPSHIKAHSSAASSPAEAAGPPAGAAETVFSGRTAADADAASTVISDNGSLGKLKRELFYTWRSNELLDRHQQYLNQVAHVLNRILMLPLKQPADVDVLLPTLKTVIFLDDDSPATASGPHSPQQHMTIFADPDLPFNPSYWAVCHDALLTLLRNSFSAPPGGFASRTTEGIRAAKERCLQQRGYRVVQIGFSEVEQCMGSSQSQGAQRARNKPADYSALEALLRKKLQL